MHMKAQGVSGQNFVSVSATKQEGLPDRTFEMVGEAGTKYCTLLCGGGKMLIFVSVLEPKATGSGTIF